MKDTDFDGLDDKNDNAKLDNSITGNITMSNNQVFEIGMKNKTYMDYRYFFMDEYNYYNELSEMSFILSQSVYDRNDNDLSSINKINNAIGLNLTKRSVIEENIKPYNLNYETEYAVGYKKVEYSKNNSGNEYIKKVIIPIVIPGVSEKSKGKTYGEIGKVNWTEECDEGEESHHVKSYEIYAEMIKYDIMETYTKLTLNNIEKEYKKVYWITGYKEGGAIANILAAKLRDMGETVYAYTFGAPMTIYNNTDEPGYTKTGYSGRYYGIFNVVNEDDVYASMMPQEMGFSRYGKTCFGDGGGIANYNSSSIKAERDKVYKKFNYMFKNT